MGMGYKGKKLRSERRREDAKKRDSKWYNR